MFVFLPPKLTKINDTMAILRSVYGSGFVKRIGNVVGQKAGEGKYRISSYQPEVVNPRTTPQQVQRSKFSFLGKLAVIMGDSAIIGWSNTKYRTTQLAFISRNLPNVKMDILGDPTQVNPTLTMPAMMLSDGGLITPSLELSATNESTIKVIARTAYGMEANRPTSVIVVAVCLKEVSRPGYRASVAEYDYTKDEDGEIATTAHELPVDVGAGATPPAGFPVVVFAYNKQLPLGGHRSHYGNVESAQVGGVDAFAAVDTIKANSGRALYSKTMHNMINLK